MPVERSIIGKVTHRSRVVVERAPVANFAKALKCEDPVYQDPRAASEAGLEAMPVPPTFPFVMEHWGNYPELQSSEPVDLNAIAEVIGGRLAHGGILLHGEEEFEYRRPMMVGDRLSGVTVVADVYEKESKGHLMTFLVTETTWTDESTGEVVVVARSNLIHRA